jgi:biotin carboxylase
MSITKTILILGGGTMQIPAIAIAKSKGWVVILADGNPDAEARGLVDYFEHIDLKNKEAIADSARSYKERIGLDGVFTAGTDFSTSVAFIAQSLGLPGIGYETACNATDKARMRALFREKGVPSPLYVSLMQNDDPLARMNGIGFPVVLKPVDNMGARGVIKVETKDEVLPAFESAIAFSRSGKVILEEYMEGPELSLDALVWKGEITVCGVADRHIFFPPYFVEMGHTMPTILPDTQVAEAIGVFKSGIRSLGIDIGAAKGDIKITSRGAMIGEIAARLSGGYMSGWTYPYASGVVVTEAALNIAVGDPPGDLNPRIHAVSAERAFISIPGKIRDISGFDKAVSMPKIKAGFIRVKKGSDVVFPKNNVEKCGNMISSDTVREEAVLAARKAAASLLIRLEPDNGKTERFLFGTQSVNGESDAAAFDLSEEENLMALSGMSPFSIRSAFSNIREIAVIPLPKLSSEKATDWHGTPIDEAFGEFLSVSGISVSTKSASHPFVLGSVFWKAFLKGGVQAGLYVLDTLVYIVGKKGDIESRLESWK